VHHEEEGQLQSRIRFSALGGFDQRSVSWGSLLHMITIFCDFCIFSANKLACFSITIVTISFLQKLAVV
jgi:hypothetical protein